MTPIAGTLSRRGSLRTSGLAAGGAIVVAAGGLGVRAWAPGVFGDLYAGPAFEPWRDWRRGRHQGSLGLVSAAILASNPHNSQPWLFRVGERHVELFADPSRHLGTIDPFRREMHLGLGCALENIAVAARGLGYRPHVALRPGPAEDTLVARVDLTDGAPDAGAHFRAIAERHTSRAAYDRARPLPRATLDALGAQVTSAHTRLVLLDAGSAEGRLFAKATVRATEQFVADAELSRDSYRWFRHALADVNRHCDGVTTLAAGLPEGILRLALSLPGRVIGDPGRAWLAATRARRRCSASSRCGTRPTSFSASRPDDSGSAFTSRRLATASRCSRSTSSWNSRSATASWVARGRRPRTSRAWWAMIDSRVCSAFGAATRQRPRRPRRDAACAQWCRPSGDGRSHRRVEGPWAPARGMIAVCDAAFTMWD